MFTKEINRSAKTFVSGKRAALILGLSLVCFVLLANNAIAAPYGLKPGKPYAGQKITVLWHIAEQFKAIERRTHRFTDLTGIEVDYVWVPFPNLHDKVTSELVAGKGTYDAVNVSDYWLPAFAQFLVPLDDLFKRDGVDMNRYPPAYREQVYWKGKLYAMQLRAHAHLLYYRKDILDKLGLEIPKTWQELSVVGKKIQEKTDLKGIALFYGRPSPVAMHNIQNWVPMLWSAGLELFDENWKPAFNTEKGVEVTQKYIDYYLKDQITPRGSVTFSEYDAIVSFCQSRSAMTIAYTYAYGIFRNPKRALPQVVENVRTAPLPRWEGKKVASTTISHIIGIPKTAKLKEAAWEWMKWMSNPDLEKEWVKAGEGIIMVHEANLMDPELNKMHHNFYYSVAGTVEGAQRFPLIPEWAEVSSYLSIAISEAIVGAPVKEALDRAAKAIYKVMERAGYYK